MKLARRHDATITRQDFLRILPAATGEAQICESAGMFFGRGWSLRLTAMPPLEIGSVRLERHRVEIEFDGLTEEEQERFMQRFTLHYQRGGG